MKRGPQAGYLEPAELMVKPTGIGRFYMGKSNKILQTRKWLHSYLVHAVPTFQSVKSFKFLPIWFLYLSFDSKKRG